MSITLVQVIVSGLLLGAVYALFSSGLTLIWGMMNVVNFAHGDFVMLGMYAAVMVWTALGGGPFAAVPIAAMLIATLGVASYFLLVRHIMRGPMLAHKGFEEGIAVAELIAGLPGHVNFDTIPWVIYTEPELAWVGKTEAQLKAEGIPYKAGSFPFAANGRAVAMIEPAGFVKILADAATDRILGVHIIAAQASEMIAEATVVMEFGGSAEDLARTCHAHPTLTEAVKEAALAVDKRAIHNLIHASENPAEAKHEIAHWFSKTELHTYKRAEEDVMF